MEQRSGTQHKAAAFLADVLRGVAIGVAFIIPGFSGGSVAALLGVYERLVGAVADLFKRFKESVLTLLPILMGMLVGIAALILPIQWGLAHFPIPTVSLFVGLALGGLPTVAGKIKGRPRAVHLAACALALALAAGLSFLPVAGEVDLFSLGFEGYLLLVLVGIAGSAALVVPGISGSMLLLIFGYYNPVVRLLTEHLLRGDRVGICLAVIACLALGIALGFFAISVLMRNLLKKFPRGTYFAIFGFIVGSLPAVYASTVRGADRALSALYSQPWYWIAAVLLLLAGIALSLALSVLAARAAKRRNENRSAE